jgi:hypothetical protein
MKWIAARPWVWVLGLSAPVLLMLLFAGQLEPQIQPDTSTYEGISFHSWHEALAGIRTVGYPLILHTVLWLGGSYAVLPAVHASAYFAAVAFFCWSLQTAGFSRASAGWASAVLLLSHMLFDFAAHVGPDLLALSAAIVAIAALISVVSRPRFFTVWLVLMLAVFASYQLRPAYLFLLFLVPLLGAGLAFTVFFVPLWSREGALLLSRLAIVTLVPFLAFAGLRWCITGHFGLVSFAGYNLIGISGQLLEETLVPALSPHVQPLAEEILLRRNQYPDWQPPSEYTAMEAMYNPMIWDIAVPAAKELHGDRSQLIDEAVGTLAREIVYERPWQYLRWLVRSGREGIRTSLCLFITDKGTRAALLCLIALQICATFKRSSAGKSVNSMISSDQRLLEVNVLLWIAISFALAKLMLIILVEVPLGRYLSPAVLWSPSIAALLCWYRWENVMQS